MAILIQKGLGIKMNKDNRVTMKRRRLMKKRSKMVDIEMLWKLQQLENKIVGCGKGYGNP